MSGFCDSSVLLSLDLVGMHILPRQAEYTVARKQGSHFSLLCLLKILLRGRPPHTFAQRCVGGDFGSLSGIFER